MALALAFLPPFKKAGRALLLSVLGFGICTIGFGLSTSLWLSVLLLATLGALDNISVVIRHVLVNVFPPSPAPPRQLPASRSHTVSSASPSALQSRIHHAVNPA